MLSFYFFPSDLQSFGDELNSSSKMAPANIWGHKNWSKYLDISNCVFTMNCSTEKKIVFWSFLGRDFICMWEKFQSSQSSNSGYLQKYPIFSTTNDPILFLCLDICIFTSVQTKKLHLVEKWVKSSHLLFIIFSLSNCNYGSIVQCRCTSLQCIVDHYHHSLKAIKDLPW